MDECRIYPSKLSGRLFVPPSKSHTLRAIFFAMLGSGVSEIDNALLSSDSEAMIHAISSFGSKVTQKNDFLRIQGGFSPSEDVIDAGNSGIVLRFISAISSLLSCYTEVTGDVSIRTRRPIKPLLHALRQLGAIAESARGDGYAPVLIRGPIHPGKCQLDGTDSQHVSALLIATSFLKGSSEILVKNPGETPWIDLTLNWLHRLGISIYRESYSYYRIQGGLSYEGLTYTVPGDFSSAAFPIVAALITQSNLEISGLDPSDVQGDKILINLLNQMGGEISWKKNTLFVGSNSLQGQSIDVNYCIDALPILAVLGCFAKGKTHLYNGASARYKESDRIRSICQELKKMGATIEELPDGLIVHESKLVGSSLQTYEDHRIALSLMIAALGAETPSQIKGISCIQKTYPTFFQDFQKIGAEFELDPLRV